MKKIILYTTILAAVVTACSKLDNEPIQKEEKPDSEVKMITEKVSAKVDPESKATIANEGATFSWTEGDNIAVHVTDGVTSKFVFTSDEGAQGASTSGPSASFTVAYEEGYSRDAFAVYPSSIVTAGSYNTGTSTLTVTLPANYTLDKVTGENTPCPMIATNTAGSGWTFKQLCALLRLTVNGIPSDATGIVIQFPGKKVNGDFPVVSSSTPVTYTIETSVPTDNQDKITVTFAAGITSATVNIPLPTGTYEDVYITPVGSATKVAAVRHVNAKPYPYDGYYNATRGHGRKLTATLVCFSVSATKKVIFSPGNLQATYDYGGSSWIWRFAAHQYDYASGNGLINGKGTLSSDGTVDLFGFSTTSSAYGIWNDKTSSNFSGEFVDWGGKTIGGHSSGYWSTLTNTEFQYLLNNRSSKSFAKISTNGFMGASTDPDPTPYVTGIVIFPDGFVWNEETMGPESAVNDYYNAPTQSYYGWISSKSRWDNLEAAGAVFLPSVGQRNGTTTQYTQHGYYWFNDGYVFYNQNGGLPGKVKFNYSNYSSNKHLGCSVRLVHEVE